MSPLGANNRQGPPEPPHQAGQRPDLDEEGIRSGKLVNIFVCAAMVFACLVVDVYVVMEDNITVMMGVLAFCIPCCVVLFVGWSSDDSGRHLRAAQRSHRRYRASPVGALADSVLTDIPVKLLDMFMGDDGIEMTFLAFVLPFAVVLGFFLYLPNTHDYPEPLRTFLEWKPRFGVSRYRRRY